MPRRKEQDATNPPLRQIRTEGEALARSLRMQGYSPAGAIATLCSALATVACQQGRADLLASSVHEIAAQFFACRTQELGRERGRIQ